MLGQVAGQPSSRDVMPRQEPGGSYSPPALMGQRSGRKTKHCHGGAHTIESAEPTTYPVFAAEPRPRVASRHIKI